MNLFELREKVIAACDAAYEFKDNPNEVPVCIQIDDMAMWSSEIELTYDGDGLASGCIIHGFLSEHAKEQITEII